MLHLPVAVPAELTSSAPSASLAAAFGAVATSDPVPVTVTWAPRLLEDLQAQARDTPCESDARAAVNPLRSECCKSDAVWVSEIS